MAIMTALDFLPFSHNKFCQMYRIDQSRLFTDEQWRNGGAENSGVSRLFGNHEGSAEGQNVGRISTFDREIIVLLQINVESTLTENPNFGVLFNTVL